MSEIGLCIDIYMIDLYINLAEDGTLAVDVDAVVVKTTNSLVNADIVGYMVINGRIAESASMANLEPRVLHLQLKDPTTPLQTSAMKSRTLTLPTKLQVT